MKNGLIDLNNHIHAQLERISDDAIDEKKLKIEIERGRAIASLAEKAIMNATLALRVEELKLEYEKDITSGMLENGN